ncbi:antigen peptide transporter 1 [Periophthalmus magnuspinnatus]|uniref:antigen peptide transporter 1 n=1 Tax=Periophthalmus magnuspinnatus TaxID=409849 RepID=UPI00145A5A08|nr:antigen peptide transporter 1 [Periophthalmus magnuspinnatus]
MKLAGPLLCVCLDLLLVSALWTAQHSAFLSLRPWVWLWAGGVCRAVLLLLFCGSFPGLPSWMQEARGLQSVAVLCFHFPLYTSLLWALGQPSVEELWSCHSWTRVLQGYGVTALAWVYWSRHVFPRLRSTSRSLRSWFRRDPSGKTQIDRRLQRLLGYMRPYSWRFAMVLVMVVFSSAGEMAFPQYTGRVADWIMNKEAPDAFTEAITNMVLMTVASAILELFCDLTYNVTMSYIHTFIQAEVFQAVLKQDIRFFHTTTTGELVSRITTDTNDMSEALSEKLSLLMWYSARFVFLLAFMVWQSWKLTLLTCMALPIIWVIPEIIGDFQQAISTQVQESLAKANQVATETFSNMKTVRSFANEEGETERYKNSLDKTYSLNKKEATAYAGMTWANSLTTLALKVCILYYGGTLVTRGAVSGGDLVSFILYELQFTSAVEAVMRYFPEVKKAVGASEKIFQYLDRIPQIPPDGTLAPETLEKEIEFKNVKFSYSDKMDDNNLVLKGASFKILLGKTNALLGLNRSGKSTCVKLLERFYQPQEGVILLDGQPLQSYRNQYLHEKIAVVSQDCLLFARSVDENIRYGFEKASEEDMKRAAELACAHDFITDLLSDGYNTDAGERGGQVSGGQKQRIAIARALIRQPQILILDNATSDLDAETEKKVYEAVLRLPNHCTVLLISNKMDIGQSADHIVYLHEGAVSEEGSHDKLMELKGHYARLVDQQNAGFHRRTEHS